MQWWGGGHENAEHESLTLQHTGAGSHQRHIQCIQTSCIHKRTLVSVLSEMSRDRKDSAAFRGFTVVTPLPGRGSGPNPNGDGLPDDLQPENDGECGGEVSFRREMGECVNTAPRPDSVRFTISSGRPYAHSNRYKHE